MISLKMIFKESIVRNDNLINPFLWKDIIEGIEIFSKYSPIEMEISCHLVIYIFEWRYTFSWKSESFHRRYKDYLLKKEAICSTDMKSHDTNKFAFCKNNIYYQSSKYTWNVGVPTAILVRKPKKNDWTKFIFSRFL